MITQSENQAQHPELQHIHPAARAAHIHGGTSNP